MLAAGILTCLGCGQPPGMARVPDAMDMGMGMDLAMVPTFPFSAPIWIDSTRGAFGLAAADWNGDGKVDLAVGYNSLGPQGFNLFLGDLKGGFAPPTRFLRTSIYQLEAADCNVDGKLDVCASDYMVLGDGMGNFTLPPLPPRCSDACPRTEVNGDGKLDLIKLPLSGDNISIKLGDGMGGLAAPISVFVGGLAAAAEFHDLNGDGRPDAAIAVSATHQLNVLLGDGSGGFGAPTSFPAGQSPRSVKALDLNRDRKPDLIVLNSQGGGVLLGDGTGGFAPIWQFSSAGNSAIRWLGLADFNSDGVLDVSYIDGWTLTLRLADGVGGLGAAIPITPAGPGPFPGVGVADFNSDGKPDVAVINNTTNTEVFVLINKS